MSMNEFCYILIISNFSFLIFIHFTNQITLKPSLEQMLKLIFKFSTIKGTINARLWAYMGHKGWRKDRKTFIRCYTIALKFWDEFNSNFVLSYFSSYSSIIKIWHIYLKNVEKNSKAVHLQEAQIIEQNLVIFSYCPSLCLLRLALPSPS